MGFYWHVHHDVLFEWSNNIEERIVFIRSSKPLEEIELRLRLLKPIRGKLPERVISAGEAYGKAQAAYYEAWLALKEPGALWAKVSADYRRTRIPYIAALNIHRAEIKALHAQECPDCPWNGKTIFPGSRD